MSANTKLIVAVVVTAVVVWYVSTKTTWLNF